MELKLRRWASSMRCCCSLRVFGGASYDCDCPGSKVLKRACAAFSEHCRTKRWCRREMSMRKVPCRTGGGNPPSLWQVEAQSLYLFRPFMHRVGNAAHRLGVYAEEGAPCFGCALSSANRSSFQRSLFRGAHCRMAYMATMSVESAGSVRSSAQTAWCGPGILLSFTPSEPTTMKTGAYSSPFWDSACKLGHHRSCLAKANTGATIVHGIYDLADKVGTLCCTFPAPRKRPRSSGSNARAKSASTAPVLGPDWRRYTLRIGESTASTVEL